MERDPLDVEPREQLRREMESGRRRCGGAGLVRVDRLVAARVGERLRDVGRQRRLALRLALEPDAPAALAERLEQLDGPEPLAGAESARGARERLPDAVPERLDQQHLGRAAGLPPQVQARRNDPACR